MVTKTVKKSNSIKPSHAKRPTPKATARKDFIADVERILNGVNAKTPREVRVQRYCYAMGSTYTAVIAGLITQQEKEKILHNLHTEWQL